jgi:membrane-associated protein
MPYPTFLLWSGLSGTLWSVWVCLSAYFISSALAGYPIASIIVSTCVGTVLISGAVWLSNRHRRAVRPTSDRDGERA